MKQKKLLAVVTGASRGIGKAIVEELLNAGYEVIGTGRNKDSGLVNTEYFQVDFLNEGSTQNFVSFLKKREVDILVNNAGINKVDKFTNIKAQDFDEILRVNLKTPFMLSQTVIPGMTKRKWGRIVNTSSIGTKFGGGLKNFAYSLSKFNNEFFPAYFKNVYSKNVIINSLQIGLTKTKILKKLRIKNYKKRVKVIPLNRMAKPSEVADYIFYLCNDKNKLLTGSVINISGGE